MTEKIPAMQLNKFLAHAGVASRRQAVLLIQKGSVSVNNTVIKDPAFQVGPNDVVTVHGKRVALKEPVYLLLNKPVGYITTTADEKGRRTVMDLLDKKFNKDRLYPVGRLDRNTTGLLLLTNDGELAQRLTHPRYQVPKHYQVTVHKPFTEVDRKTVLDGVRLPDGIVRVESISHPLGHRKNNIRLTLKSGKYRVVRRLFEALGYQVKKLDRIGYAFFKKRGLPIGFWRTLSKKEIAMLKQLVKEH